MAHECPECGLVCYCKGDIDDLILNFDEDVNRCEHCPLDGYDPDEVELDRYWDDKLHAMRDGD